MTRWIAPIAAFCLPVLAWAQDAAVSQAVGHGQVNWTNKTITATGSGAPNLKAANAAVARLGAERAAKMDAFRNVVEAVRGIRLSGNKDAGSTIDQTPELKAKIEGIVQGFKVIDTKYYSDGGVDVVLQGPLDGVLAEALVSDIGKTAKAGTAEDGTTGVVINAKGLGVTPAMAPRILDESGNVVYAASLVNVEAMRRHGMVAYQKSLDLAQKDARVGPKPLILKASRAAEAGSSDIVLSSTDAEKLKKLKGVQNEGNFVIVID